MYNNFLKGLITNKSEPFKDINDETSFLIAALKDYYSENEVKDFKWHRRQEELAYLKNGVTYQMIKKSFK